MLLKRMLGPYFVEFEEFKYIFIVYLCFSKSMWHSTRINISLFLRTSLSVQNLIISVAAHDEDEMQQAHPALLWLMTCQVPKSQNQKLENVA